MYWLLAIAASTTTHAFLKPAATPRRTALRAAKEVDTSRWEYYAKHPMARGAKLGAGACRVFYAEWRARRHARKSRDAKADAVRSKAAARVADLLIALGPTYVKLGQIASCRKELEKTPWAAALQRLQDDVPGFDGGGAEIARCLGPRYAAHFASVDDRPVAAASLGQVHLGVLRNGTRVAVKVQRPALREIYDRDVTLLRKMFAFLDRRKWKVGVEQKWLDIFDDAAALLYREIDYAPRRATASGSSDFSGVPWVAAPAVYPELSGETVLTMEYLPGVSLKDLDAIAADPELDARSLATRLGQAYFLQFCKHRFFNTDPHAGNLAADGGFAPGGRLIFYDFGQAAALSADEAAGALGLLEGIIDADAAKTVDAFERMGVVKNGFDRAAVEATIASNFRSGLVTSRAQRAVAAGEPGDDAGDGAPAVLGDFQLPATLAFASRAMSQMQGLAIEEKGVATYLQDELKKKLKLG
ncbi:hypothetical protein JL720_16200 [Aureococcus anophagefferens]|nr:hypothetical protein JL720_16200 [Aureococcus anophagefferens]